MAPRVEIDDRRWPRVYAKWPSDAVSDEEFKRAVAQLSSFTRRGQPYVTILDARVAVRPTPLQRGVAARQQQLDAEYTRRWLRGSAIIVSNPVLVGVVTAINWISPPPYPQKIFASPEAAEAWCDVQLGLVSEQPKSRR